jgi:hypothetical protein
MSLPETEKVLGAEHPDTAMTLSNLGRLFADLGQPDKAEPLLLRAIAVGDKVLGAAHPLTQRFQSNYARLLLMTDRPAAAATPGSMRMRGCRVAQSYSTCKRCRAPSRLRSGLENALRVTCFTSGHRDLRDKHLQATGIGSRTGD